MLHDVVCDSGGVDNIFYIFYNLWSLMGTAIIFSAGFSKMESKVQALQPSLTETQNEPAGHMVQAAVPLVRATSSAGQLEQVPEPGCVEGNESIFSVLVSGILFLFSRQIAV